MKTIVAIDPGASGAIVVLTPLDTTDPSYSLTLHKMPETLQDLEYRLREDCGNARNVAVVMENVGNHVEGDSASRSAGFARHVGQLEGILAGLGVKIAYVHPQIWMRVFPERPRALRKHEKIGLSAKEIKDKNAERKRDRKRYIQSEMQKLFPNVRVTLWNADALGIAYWYVSTQLGQKLQTEQRRIE